MIEHNMLVVESSNRKRCEEVWQALDAMHKECLGDHSFAAEKNPWVPLELMSDPITHSVEVIIEGEAEEIINKNFSKLPIHYGRTKSAGVRNLSNSLS